MKEYRAIVLHQPWASLVALGIKKYETRSWSTKYRGKLLICSAKVSYTPNTWLGDCLISDKTNQICQLAGMGKFHKVTLDFFNCNLPLGKVLCVVDLDGCYLMTTDGENIKAEGREVSQLEQLCGDWQAGRKAWELNNLVLLPEPVPIKGKQGLWIPERSVIEQVESRLRNRNAKG